MGLAVLLLRQETQKLLGSQTLLPQVPREGVSLTMEQLQMAYAHRFILQAVIYRFIAAAAQWGFCVLLMILGAIAGVAVATAVVLVFFSVLDFLMQNIFPVGLLR